MSRLQLLRCVAQPLDFSPSLLASHLQFRVLPHDQAVFLVVNGGEAGSLPNPAVPSCETAIPGETGSPIDAYWDAERDEGGA